MIIAPSHTPGRHCASSGMADLVNHHGIDWSEALCFGIGMGLGLWYLGFEGQGASRMIHVRSQDIEHQFFCRMGAGFAWETFPNPDDAHNALIEAISSGRPALLRTDIYYLPYYNSSTHFPGHVIVVWGFDSQKELFFVSDTARTALVEVPFSAMKRARYSKNPFFPMQGNQFAPSSLNAPENLPAVIARAIVDQSCQILEPPFDFAGIKALDRWLDELSLWKDFDDWKWVSRFAYQVIERRGTGGGGFRLMYADFLDEASRLIPQIRALGLNQRMRALAEAWTNLALALKAVSEKEKPDFGQVAPQLAKVRKLCLDYHQRAVDLSAA
ncbi:MAG: DUF4872 domain-containing protein [Desulfatibacillaceae bacterium]|nr:DUF4872 domain-containing protein [Desulfatibacillaceae bacterium]